MTCFDTGLSALLSVDLWVKWVTIGSLIAGVYVALRALKVAQNTIKESKEATKNATAYAAYQHYLQLAMQYPEFAKGYHAISSNDEKYAKYIWYISNMLFAFEQIIEVNENQADTSWKKSINKQLGYHVAHFAKSSAVRDELYNPILVKLIIISIDAAQTD